MRLKILHAVALYILATSTALAEPLTAPISDVQGAPNGLTATGIANQNIAAMINSSGSFDGTEPTTSGGVRIFRDGIASQCVPAKSFPGTFGSGNVYDEYTFFNNGPETCVTVSWNEGTCGVSAHASAYSGTFNPNDLSVNYLGDVGSSTTQDFSFIAPANSPIVIVVSSTSGVPAPCSYSFTSAQLDENATAIPSLNQWGLIILSMLLVISAFAYRRKQHL